MILHGDSLDVLKTLPANHYQVCVTSPPYWSLRDYKVPPTVWGGDMVCDHEWVGAGAKEGFTGKARWQHVQNGKGESHTPSADRGRLSRDKHPEAWGLITQGAFCAQCGAWCGVLGLEPTPELYIAHVVQLFREVRRVLRKDGTLWVNLGDSYANDAKGPRGTDKSTLTGGRDYERNASSTSPQQKGWRGSTLGIKRKDLIGIPWAVAFALRADGWYLRRDIVWDKPNPKPESALDRPSTAHEYLFLFSKRAAYFYDNVAVREYATTGNHQHRNVNGPEASHVPGASPHAGLRKTAGPGAGRNCRSVWRIQVRPYKEAHFATFPEELPARCIRAGSSEHGGCATCGAPFRRLVRKGDWSPTQLAIAGANAQGEYRGGATKPYVGGRAEDPSDLKRRILAGMRERVTVGWAPTCKCPPLSAPVPCRVLDPFAGSSATGAAAIRLGRDFTGIELNPEYIDMAERRLKKGGRTPQAEEAEARRRARGGR